MIDGLFPVCTFFLSSLLSLFLFLHIFSFVISFFHSFFLSVGPFFPSFFRLMICPVHTGAPGHRLVSIINVLRDVSVQITEPCVIVLPSSMCCMTSLSNNGVLNHRMAFFVRMLRDVFLEVGVPCVVLWSCTCVA